MNAYLAAYPGCSKETAKANSYRLLQKPEIQEWTHTYKAEAGARNNVTVDEIIANLRDARDKAMAVGKFADAIKASTALGDYLGIFNSKAKIEVNMTDNNPYKVGSEDETKRRLARIAGLSVVSGGKG